MKKLFCVLLLLACGTASAQVLCPSGYNFNGLCLSNPKGTAILGGQDGTGTNGQGGSITIVPGAPTGSSTAVGDFTLQLDPTNPNVNFKCSNPTIGGVGTASCSFNGVSTLSTLANTFSAASILRARDYGILPANTAVQNDVGLVLLKAAMQASSTTVWRVIFEPGAYVYTNTRWLYGVQNVILEAYGSSFQSTGAHLGAFELNDLFNDWGDQYFPGTGVYANGYLINTAVAGATSITTTTHADAGNFTPGMRVLLHGYDQQATGYPPNMRYYEYLTVLTANSTTGVVTFTHELQNAYDSRWWDVANYAGTGKAFGAPRILSLDRANYVMPKLIWLRGVTLLANPGGRQTLLLPAELTILEDIVAPNFNIATTGVAIIRRSKFISNVAGDGNSVDKITGRAIIEDSILDGQSGGVSDALTANSGNVSLIRSKFFGTIDNLTPRVISISDCDVIPSAANGSGIGSADNQPIPSVYIENTRVYNAGSVSNGFTNKASPGNSLTVGSVVGTDIRITFDATGIAVSHQIDYGMQLTNTVTGNTGVITAIYYEAGAPGTLRIAGTWAAPAPADVFNYYDVIQISDGGGNTIPGTTLAFWRSPPGPIAPTGLTLPSPILTGTLTTAALTSAGAVNLNVSNNAVTNIGTGTTTSAVSIGGGSNTVNVVGTTNINVNNNRATNIGTGTTTSNVTLGGGSNNVNITANSSNINGSVQINTNNNQATNIGTGTTTTAVSIGGGSNNVNVNAGAMNVTAATNINASNNQATNIGTGTTTSAVAIGGGSNNVNVTANNLNATGIINLNASNNTATNIGSGTTTSPVTLGGGSNGVVINANQAGSIKEPALISSGTKFTTSGCSISATSGGASAGTFTLGANTCTAVITINGATGLTSNTGWSCQAHDRTAPAVLIGGESSSTATTASFTIPAGAGATDVISYSCIGY